MQQLKGDFDAKLPSVESEQSTSNISYMYRDLKWKVTKKGVNWTWVNQSDEMRVNTLKSIDSIVAFGNYNADYLRSISAVDFQFTLNSVQERCEKRAEQARKANKPK